MRARSFLLFWCFALAIVAPVEAAGRRGGESLDRVLPQIRSSVPGTFYDAEGPFFSPSGEPSYRIKWMTPDGRLIWFSVDARSGQVLGGIPGSSSRAYGQDNGRNRGGDADNRGSSWNRGNFRDDNNGWDRPSAADRNTDRGGWNRGGWDRREDTARRPETRNQDSRNQDRSRPDDRDQDGRRGWRPPGGYERGGRENPDRGNSGRGSNHRGRDDNRRHDRDGR